MTIEFKLPELGENIETADVTKILVKVGDKVEKDQSVFEIETDKATVEVPIEFGGVIKEIKIKEGEKVEVGAVVLVVELKEGGAAQPEAKPAEPAQPENLKLAQPVNTQPDNLFNKQKVNRALMFLTK